MPKVIINTLTSLIGNESSAVSALNQNFNAIQDAMENTLSRDGEAPNEVEDDIDMNSNRITNLPEAVGDAEPMRKAEFDDIVTDIAEVAQIKIDTLAAQSAAEQAKAGAVAAENNAEASEELARQWATEDEDTLILDPNGNGFSARHWSIKAGNSAAGVNLPGIEPGDAGKVLRVNNDEDAHEFVTGVTVTASGTYSGLTIDSEDNTLTLNMGEGTLEGTLSEFNTALQGNTFGTFAAPQTDHAIPRADGTEGLLQTSGVTISDADVVAGATIDSDSNTLTLDLNEGTLTGTLAEFKTAVSDDDLVGAAELASNANGLGASLIGTEDAGDDFTATTVEGALDELFALGESLGGSLTAHIADTDNPHSVTPAQLNLVIGTDVQAWDDDLDDIAALSPDDGNFIVGDGTDWTAESGATARTSLDVYSTGEANALFEQANPDILKADVGDTLTAGFLTDSFSGGTQSSGTYTPAPGTGQENFQHIVNGGAFTLAPPANPCNVVLEITNNASAGSITTSGFTQVTGDSFTTTDGDDFLCFITRSQNFSHLNVVALQ